MTPPAPGFPLVVAAPSGAGKTTLSRMLIERVPSAVFSVSVTTRARRAYERGGVHYHFVDDNEFDRLIADGELVEWAEVHGHRYGTPRAAVETEIAAGRVVVLDIDVQGARQVRRVFPDVVLVFVLPPSVAELHRRLSGRGSEGVAELHRRLRNARAELPFAAEFDYVVINDDMERGVRALESIVVAERHRARRLKALEAQLRRLDEDLEAILEDS